MKPNDVTLGMRAKFTAHDDVFHEGQREGKVGTIVADATGSRGSNFGADESMGLGGACYWQLDGDPAVFITGLEDLTAEK